MATIRVQETTQEDIDLLKYKLRYSDMSECLARGVDPIAALQFSVDRSLVCWTYLYNDEVVCITGVCAIGTVFSSIGSAWLLGSDLMKKKDVGLYVLKNCKKYLDCMLDTFDVLTNHVSNDNKISMKWLGWLGFKMAEPEPIGIHGELFRYFEKRREE